MQRLGPYVDSARFRLWSLAMKVENPRAYERLWSVRALHGMNRMYARIWHHVEVLSPCRLPPTGAAILICNHTAGLDPVLLQATSPRLITWMMAREYYDLPGLRQFSDHLRYIPVNRELRDSTSLRAGLRALKEGKVLGVFPEGRIATNRGLLEFQGGVGVMAQRAGVPVYPAYIAGLPLNMSIAGSLLGRQEVRIAYGPPIMGTADKPLTGAQLRESVDTLRRQLFAHSPLHGRFQLCGNA
jgi:1-acyl-sn-glycerol-3-phosphate acyltransferase